MDRGRAEAPSSGGACEVPGRVSALGGSPWPLEEHGGVEESPESEATESDPEELEAAEVPVEAAVDAEGDGEPQGDEERLGKSPWTVLAEARGSGRGGGDHPLSRGGLSSPTLRRSTELKGACL